MKKILGLAVILCGFFCLASCSTSESSEFRFSPSSVTVKVGESTTVQVIIKDEIGGQKQCSFSASPSGIVGFPAEQSANSLTIVGMSAGSATVTGYVDDNPSLKGTLKVTVTE